ncbi:glycosyltransferase 87 family protein [Streptomyces sp. NBC_01716]|uniref:glycosyltransferase 87 family protein n=1 Tax=Streptomyces sp. NBC_01716 TaxID=2975917 RepID=UPI002E340647|nr:glycosyltransferase 87 family protein [Streptomyces sp. NBC_01716]
MTDLSMTERWSTGWRPMSRRRRYLLLGVLCAVVTAFVATVPYHRDWFDLWVYYDAVNHWTGAEGGVRGAGLYDYRVPGQSYGFTYPPFAALCVLPLSLFSWPVALTAGVAANLGALALILRRLAEPVIRRHGLDRWTAYTLILCMLALLEPVYDSISFGQVNLLLLALVLTDARLLSTGSRWAGVGIGLAAAVKLTPAIFIGYLVVTRRWRAAGTAAAVAVGATLLALWLAPDASHAYWTSALWDTSRIGDLSYVSNQSWQGVLARLSAPAEPERLWWACGVLAVVGAWAYRVDKARAVGDVRGGIALTGAAACLVSPVTWVHHLVWLLPALAVLADRALEPPRRGRPLIAAVSVYVILCSYVVWLWRFDVGGVDGFVGSNMFVWTELALLLTLPVRPPYPALREPSGGPARPAPERRGAAAATP